MIQSCSCGCAASKFAVSGRPLTRFYCHCTICQEYTNGPFNDVTAFWASAVSVADSKSVLFKRYRPPPALDRGSCDKCGGPVVEFLSIAPGLRLAFVPSQNFADPQSLPPARAHIFYRSRVADVSDDLPKISGYWRSEWAVSRLLLASILK